MEELLLNIEISFKTIKQLYKDTKEVVDNFKTIIEKTETSEKIIYKQIEKSLIGKDWKENT